MHNQKFVLPLCCQSIQLTFNFMTTFTINPAKIKNIITHAGRHHADEILACAILMELAPQVIDVHRIKQPVADLLPNLMATLPDYLVLDIGREYTNKVLDHHHDANLPATCELVLNHLPDQYSDFIEAIRPLSKQVSDVDLGLAKADIGTFNWVVNQMTFEQALDMARTCVKSTINQVKAKQAMVKELVSAPVIAIKDGGKISLINASGPWKDEAKKLDIIAAVHNAGNQWNLVVTDNSTHKLPMDLPQAIFVHNSGFMAAFNTQGEAVNAAKVWADMA